MARLFDGDRGKVRAVGNGERSARWNVDDPDDMLLSLDPPDMLSRLSATIVRAGPIARREG